MKKSLMRLFCILYTLALISGCSTKTGTGQNQDDTQSSNSPGTICTNHVEVPLPSPDFEVYSALSDPMRSTRPHAQPYNGPIADVHLHWGKQSNNNAAYFNGIGDALKRNNIEMAIFMPKPGDPNGQLYDQISTLIELDDQRIQVFFGGDYLTSWLNTACQDGYSDTDLNSIKSRLNADLLNTQCSGIGELGLFHFEKFEGQSVYQYQPNFQPFLDFMEIIDQKKAWLDFHAEPYDQEGNSLESMVFGMLALVSDRYPGIRLIHSHSGMTNPVNVERILDTYPDLVMNIKIITGAWDYLEPINNSQGELYEDWAALFEKMPERFMIGTDAKFKDDQGFAEYDDLIETIRLALGSINEDAAKKIACENAQELF